MTSNLDLQKILVEIFWSEKKIKYTQEVIENKQYQNSNSKDAEKTPQDQTVIEINIHLSFKTISMDSIR